MTAEQFAKWLAAMKARTLITSDADAGRQLGISANSVVALKKQGGDMRTALACAALLAGLEPYR